MKWIWEHKKLVFSCIFVALLVILLSQAKITFLERDSGSRRQHAGAEQRGNVEGSAAGLPVSDDRGE
jgi:hypothetical protein